jgi:hypothetical protein
MGPIRVHAVSALDLQCKRCLTRQSLYDVCLYRFSLFLVNMEYMQFLGKSTESCRTLPKVMYVVDNLTIA